MDSYNQSGLMLEYQHIKLLQNLQSCSMFYRLANIYGMWYKALQCVVVLMACSRPSHSSSDS